MSKAHYTRTGPVGKELTDQNVTWDSKLLMFDNLNFFPVFSTLLVQNRRGEQQEVVYLDESRVMLKYLLPLNEVIVDFYDELKTQSSGYARFVVDLYESLPFLPWSIVVIGKFLSRMREWRLGGGNGLSSVFPLFGFLLQRSWISNSTSSKKYSKF